MSDRARRVTRRHLLRAGAVVGLAAACGPGGTTAPAGAPTPAAATAAATARAFDWKRYAGQSIRFLDWNGTWGSFLIKKKDEFESLTGTKIEWELLPQEQHRQKVQTELTARNRDLDLIFIAPHVDGPKYWKAGWLEPLDPFLQDPGQTPSDWEAKDFAEGLWKTSQFDGKQATIPIASEVQCITYRKDLFEQKGLKPPTTLDELRKVAAALHDPPKVFGVVSRGSAVQGPVTFSSFLYSFGGDYTDDKRACTIDQKPALDAMEFWGSLYRDYGPPGMSAMNFAQSTALFSQGRVAMIIDANGFRAIYTDRSKSQVGDLISYAMFPKGPVSQTPGIFTAGPAISALSAKKGPAWYFILWSTGKQSQLATHLNGTAAVRRSAWQAPEAKQGTDPAWVDVTLKTMDLSSRGYSPRVVSVLEVRNRVGELLVKVLGGTTGPALKDEAAKACRDISDIIKRTE